MNISHLDYVQLYIYSLWNLCTSMILLLTWVHDTLGYKNIIIVTKSITETETEAFCI